MPVALSIGDRFSRELVDVEPESCDSAVVEDGSDTLMASHRTVVSLGYVGDRGESWTEAEELGPKRCTGIAGYDRKEKSTR